MNDINHIRTLDLLCSLDEALNSNALVTFLSDKHQNLIYRATLKFFSTLNLHTPSSFKLEDIHHLDECKVNFSLSCSILNKPHLLQISFHKNGEINITKKIKIPEEESLEAFA